MRDFNIKYKALRRIPTHSFVSLHSIISIKIYPNVISFANPCKCCGMGESGFSIIPKYMRKMCSDFNIKLYRTINFPSPEPIKVILWMKNLTRAYHDPLILTYATQTPVLRSCPVLLAKALGLYYRTPPEASRPDNRKPSTLMGCVPEESLHWSSQRTFGLTSVVFLLVGFISISIDVSTCGDSGPAGRIPHYQPADDSICAPLPFQKAVDRFVITHFNTMANPNKEKSWQRPSPGGGEPAVIGNVRGTCHESFMSSWLKSCKNFVYCNSYSHDTIRSQFCRCHDSWAAKFLPELLMIFRVKATQIYWRILIMSL